MIPLCGASVVPQSRTDPFTVTSHYVPICAVARVVAGMPSRLIAFFSEARPVQLEEDNLSYLPRQFCQFGGWR